MNAKQTSTLRKTKTQVAIYFMYLIFMNLIISCNTFKVITKDKITANRINDYVLRDKYFIVHEYDTIWHLDATNATKSSLFGVKTILPEWHKSYKLPPAEKKNEFNLHDKLARSVVNEIHLYTNHVYKLDSVRVSIPIDSINYYQIYRQQYKAWPFVVGSIVILPPLIIIIVYAISGGVSFPY